MRTRNSSWSAKAHTFVIAVQLPQQQQFDSDRTVERERGSPAHCNLLFSLLFLIVDDGIWASQYHVKRGHMTVDAAIEAIAASLKDPKDLLVLFLHSSISFFFFWCSLFSFSETVCQVFLFLLFIKPRDTSSQLPYLFCFSFKISVLGLFVLFMRIEDFCLLIDMGFLIGSFGCVNSYSKKQCRALFWWLKAAVKKAVKKNGGKKRFKFQYDPSSYALNFDDGCCNLGASGDAFKHGNTNTDTNILQESHLILWVYVLWVEEPWEWYLFVFFGLFCTFSLPNFMSLLLPINPIKQLNSRKHSIIKCSVKCPAGHFCPGKCIAVPLIACPWICCWDIRGHQQDNIFKVWSQPWNHLY